MRGYQKKVIYIKNTGSECFEEAYFVIKSDTGPNIGSHEKMVDEANRIIKESFENKKKSLFRLIGPHLGAFLMGAFISVFICIIINLFK